MKRQISLMLKILLLLSLSSLAACSQSVVIHSESEDVRVRVDLAATPEQQEKGLMFVASMPEDKGMLFVFDSEGPRQFWMKNTKIPLDLLFINSKKSIVDIKENFQPCTADPCEVYAAKAPSMYVLEVNAGFVQKYGIRKFDSVEIG